MPFSDRFVELRAPVQQWRWWQLALAAGAVVTVLGSAGGTGIIWYFSQDLPDLHAIDEHRPNVVSRVYADDRQTIGQFYIERRFLTPLSEIPDTLVQAVIAVEDARFFEHPGLDVIGILRAAWTNFRRGGRVEGASTITQQLARSLFLSPERTYTRKVKELILAYRIENRLTKEQILEMYLNQIYFGHGAYGVRAAAQTYFGKRLDELALDESALLAGLPKSPNNYSPFRNPERAKARRNHVLARMEAAGFITPGERQEATDRPLRPRRPESRDIGPYFIEHVRQQLVGMFGEEAVYTGGLEIYTTLNVELQRAAEAAVEAGLLELDKRQGWRGPLRKLTPEELGALIATPQDPDAEPPEPGEIVEGVVTKIGRDYAEVLVGPTLGRLAFEDMEWARRLLKGPDPSKDAVTVPTVKGLLKPGDVIEVAIKQVDGERVHWRLEQRPVVEGALIAIDPRNGAIRAMVGGYDFMRSEYNRAVSAQRQPGSAFKPLVYAAALRQGLSPATMLLDAPVVYEDQETHKIWKPENYEKRFYGRISLRDALIHSRNLATVRLLQRVGVNTVASFTRSLGISTPLNRDLSLALGSSSVTLEELTAAYGVFANQGYRYKPYTIARVEDINKEAKFQMLFEPEQVISQETAYLITNILEDVVRRGTGQGARRIARDRPIAGKTGTTNDFTDAWFVGYTPNLAVGVWVGFDDRRTLGEREAGARAALPIWSDFMERALANLPVMPFEIPDEILFVRIDPETGLLLPQGDGQGEVEIFARGTEPKDTAPQHVEPTDFYKLDVYEEPAPVPGPRFTPFSPQPFDTF